jgi:hypothetical protein
MSKPIQLPDVFREIQDAQDRLKRLEQYAVRNSGVVRVFATQAALPNPEGNKGLIALVDGNASGSKFQGSDGVQWVVLG